MLLKDHILSEKKKLNVCAKIKPKYFPKFVISTVYLKFLVLVIEFIKQFL